MSLGNTKQRAAQKALGSEKHRPSEIPRQAVYRLSVYLRCLNRLKAEGIQTVSSGDLAEAGGVKSAQLRKDLAYFGQFGTRGLGYNVSLLSQVIGNVLGRKKLRPVILVGVGNLGLALLFYRGFEQAGFEIIAAFDIEPNRQRNKTVKLPLLPVSELAAFLKANPVKMAILCIPASAAQETANRLVQLGVTGILDFATIVLQMPEIIVVNNVNLAIELENLSYFVREETRLPEPIP